MIFVKKTHFLHCPVKPKPHEVSSKEGIGFCKEINARGMVHRLGLDLIALGIENIGFDVDKNNGRLLENGILSHIHLGEKND